ncbi:MAG TPA: hypothetical protein VJG90_02435 [Candidatus Nanoarchaeia archaeon]|nr:hypothetical protein [Candidatus Nanoarchaeia archaeon]
MKAPKTIPVVTQEGNVAGRLSESGVIYANRGIVGSHNDNMNTARQAVAQGSSSSGQASFEYIYW